MFHFKAIVRIVGMLLLLETGMMLLCSLVSLYYQDEALTDFWLSALVTAVAGAALARIGWGSERRLTRREGYVVVSLTWVAFSLFGMLPFLISGYIPRVEDAFFEAMSGFTGTGATILDDIERLPHGLLFWRSMTQWVGGLGIIMFTIAVLPIFGVSGLQVFAAEASGLARDKVTPRIGETARWLWSIYFGMTLVLFFLLWAGGMGPFDSVCHSFTTMSTGGLSTHQDSIAYFHSPFIEYVIILFMFLSGINYTLLLVLLRGRVRKVWSDRELRWYCASVGVFVVAFTAILLHSRSGDFEETFRKALFQVVSIHTSTGYATDDYMLWPPVAWGLVLVMMISGACAGSTSGGMKCIRLVILFRVMKNEFRRIVHPNAVLPVRLGRQVVPQSIVSVVLAFSTIYVAITIASILFMLAMGMGFEEAVGCSISSVSNMGPGLGQTGPAHSWSCLPVPCKCLCSLLMLMGRLELFTILLLFTRDFWKKS